MRSLTNYPRINNIILRNRQLNFVNLTAVVYDTRVTEDTLILVYYSEETGDAAQSAGITSETNNGNITFTAANEPSETIVCDIVLISANMTNVVADATNIDYSNSTSKITATNVQDAIDEIIEDKAEKTDIAPEFSATVNYNRGQLVYNESQLYEFNQAHSAGSWDSSHVDAKDISDVITGHNGKIIKSIATDGIKTYSQYLDELNEFVSVRTILDISGNRLYPSTSIRFGSVTTSTNNEVCTLRSVKINSSGSIYKQVSISDSGAITVNNLSASIPQQGAEIRLIAFY